jgi:tRNA(Ile)-lysidine synthase
MKDISLLLETQIKQIKKKCWTEKDGVVYVKINYIKNHSSRDTVLYYLLKDFGFTNDVLNNVVNHKNISAQFFSDTHRMIIDRNELIISSISEVKNNILCFDKIPNQIIFNNFTIQCSLVPIEKLNLKENKNYAYLDVDCIDFPIVVRNLKDGDYFYPFGIGKAKNKSKVGKKKISKYFRDLKLNLLEKENTPIVFSNERALWLVGYAIDDRFKVTANTKQVLKMKIIC